MKKSSILFIVLLMTTFSFGQLPYTEKGVTISYNGYEKIGTRYEEKCKTTLDVYRVTGTVKNSNKDKAVRLMGTALLFKGNDCDWYEGHYEVRDEIYSINFADLRIWQEQGIDILPDSQLVVSAEVLVTQDKKCPYPGYRLNFQLVDSLKKPTQPQQKAPIKNPLQWSAWKSFSNDNCNSNIEYRYLVERGYALNKQVHMWFEVKNNNNKTVSYLFNLLDAKEKVHFGDQHTTNPGEITRFVHKMSGDIIKKWKLVDLIYTATGKPVCEKQQNNNPNATQANRQNNGQVANQGNQNRVKVNEEKVNYGEFNYKGIKYSGTCISRPYEPCKGGNIIVGLESGDRKITIYNMPLSNSGTYNISNGMGDNCDLNFILPYFDAAGKYKYDSSESGTVTKTSSNSFTFSCKLKSGEIITGSGSYGGSDVKSAPIEKEEQAYKTNSLSSKEESARFLAENKTKPGVVTTASGLQYKALQEGAGVRPALTNRVKMHYHGTLINGSVFDSSIDRGEPVTFKLNTLFPGLLEGVLLMKEGSKYKFFIPSDLAYGDRGAGDKIKPGAAIIFEVELLGVIK